ncbi:hypothetical protein ACWET9_32355 [Streptomyces sp. NPDC004059]
MSEQQKPAAIIPPPYPKTTPYKCETGNPVCGKPARLFPAGWRCVDHWPHSQVARQRDDEPA